MKQIKQFTLLLLVITFVFSFNGYTELIDNFEEQSHKNTDLIVSFFVISLSK